MKICLLRKVYLTPKQIALLKGVKGNGFSYMFRCCFFTISNQRNILAKLLVIRNSRHGDRQPYVHAQTYPTAERPGLLGGKYRLRACSADGNDSL